MLYQKHATKLTALLIKRSHLTYSACCLIHYVQHGNICVFLKKTSTLTGREKKQYTYIWQNMLMVVTLPSPPNANTTIGKLAQSSQVWMRAD